MDLWPAKDLLKQFAHAHHPGPAHVPGHLLEQGVFIVFIGFIVFISAQVLFPQDYLPGSRRNCYCLLLLPAGTSTPPKSAAVQCSAGGACMRPQPRPQQ
jgi:hypothetical protein